MSDYKKTWRQKFRSALSKCYGSKCGICGYNKCLQALDFHHLDPSQKDQDLSKYLANGGKWGKVREEAQKCVCLCSNCHREVHAGITEIPDDIQRFDDSLVPKEELPGFKKEITYDNCPVCSKKKNSLLKHCSIECALKANTKISFGKDDLERMIFQEKLSYSAIGKMVGVSGNAVKKRAKNLGIELPKDRRKK